MKALNMTPLVFAIFLIMACSQNVQDIKTSMIEPAQTHDTPSNPDFESQVKEYIKKFPYQDTYNYAKRYTGGDPNQERFNSFQLMDDRNVNYKNIIHPDGEYTLYFGEKPDLITGEAIKVPSKLSVVIVRVEVKDKNNPNDIEAAKTIFNGITIKGNAPETFPSIDMLGSFSENVAVEAERRMDAAFKSIPFRKTVVGPDMEPGQDVPYLNHSAGTKGGWGGPDTIS